MELTTKEKYAFGIGALGKDAIICFSGAFLAYYYTDVLYLTPYFVGVLLFVIRIWDAVSDPIMGMIIDNTQSKYGKFKWWLTIGTLLNALFFVGLFTTFSFQGKGLYLYAIIMYFFYNTTYTMMDVPYWSWLPNLTKDPRKREEVSVIPRFFATLAALIVSVAGLKAIAFLGKGNEKIGFQKVALVIAFFFVVVIGITVFFVQDSSKTENKKQNHPKIQLKEAYKILLKNDQLVALIGVLLAFNLAMQILNSFTIYYFKYAVGKESFFSLFGWTILPELLGLALFPYLAKKLSRKTSFQLACYSAMGGLLGLFVVGLIAPKNPLLTLGVGSFIKFGLGVSTGITTVGLADCIDYGEEKFGKRYESIVSSGQIFVMKVAQAFAALLIGGGLTLLGYKANETQEIHTTLGIRFLTCLLPILFVALSLWLYHKFFKLKEIN